AGACGGVAVMPDRRIAGKCIGKDFEIRKNAKDKPVIFMNGKFSVLFLSACCKNAGSLLAAVLQGMQRVIDNNGCFGMVEDADDSAIGLRLIDLRRRKRLRP